MKEQLTLNYPALFLKNREERRLQAGHLWIYSNEIDTEKSPLKNFQRGELIRVINARNKVLGIGYINPGTLLSVRILTRNPNEIINEDFFIKRLQQALTLRENIFSIPYYRLVYGEGDELPGLIVDRYDDILVVQITTAGIEQLQELIIESLQKLLKPKAILMRNDSAIRQVEGLDLYIKTALNEVPEKIELIENDTKFITSLGRGQKTGWFYDHRDNRKKLKRYVQGKQVLDVFSYIGGWGIQAGIFGAKEVLCIDSSASAIQQLQENAVLNNIPEKINILVDDAFNALKQLVMDKEKFDIVILDPPAFIKKRKDQAAGEAAYQNLNEMAIQLLSSGGILVTASCSLHLGMDTLSDIVRRAGIQAKRFVQILERGFQGPDHPVHPAIPETAYLKTLILRVG